MSQALAAATSLASLLRKSAPHQVAEAEELLRTSLDLLVQSQGALHPETLVAKNQLGQLLHETGRQDEALSLLQDTHNIRTNIVLLTLEIRLLQLKNRPLAPTSLIMMC